MFTGIIKEVGTVGHIDGAGAVRRLTVSCRDVSSGVCVGDSVAVNGICLTVTALEPGALSFDIMAETVRCSSAAALRRGVRVNLESALRIGDHLGGHIVQGHVDCVGTVDAVSRGADGVSLRIGIDQKDAHLVVGKGSVAVDGISLTVGEAGPRHFTVHLIPHTLAVTNLGDRAAGDPVNVEFDVVGKYIARSRELEKQGSGVSEELLRRANFI